MRVFSYLQRNLWTRISILRFDYMFNCSCMWSWAYFGLYLMLQLKPVL